MSSEIHPILSQNVLKLDNLKRFFVTSDEGSKYVLYQDSAIRWSYASENNYRFMKLNPPLKDIKEVLLSRSGDFLCLYSDVEMRIVEVPWSYKDVSTMEYVFQKYRYTIGNQKSKLKQVLFHSLAASENTVILLKEDDTITLVNWQDDEDELILNQHYRTLGMDGVISEIKSLSLSQDGLTLYALNASEGGDIYALYPCLPSKLRITKAELDFLMNKSLVQYDAMNSEMGSDTKMCIIKQLRYISELHKNCSALEDADVVVHENLEECRLVKGQGPFTIAPFPDRFYDCEFKEIAVLPVSKNVELLLLTLNDGTVAILYADLELTMDWDFNDYTYNSSFALIETINLEETGKLIVPAGEYGIFSISGDRCSWLINTTGWSRKMSQYLRDSNFDALTKIEFKSSVKKLKISSPVNTLNLGKFNNTKSLFLVSDQSEIMETLDPQNENRHTEGKLEKELSKASYQTNFSQPMNEIMSLNNSFLQESKMAPQTLLDPQIRQQPLENESNEVQLTALTDVSKDLLTKISKAQSLGVILHNRLQGQQYELTSQLKTGNDLLLRQKTIKETYERQLLSRDKALVRQKVILDRLVNLKGKISSIETSPKYQDMNINKMETEWFKEIRNQVITFNQYVHKQQDLKMQLEYVARELAHSNNDPADKKSLDDWDQLRKMLEEDTKILKDCNIQLNHASNELY